MTYGEPMRIEPDGTHVYSNYTRYKPVPLEKRKYAVRKPADPRAFRIRGDWFLPLDLLPDEARVMPETRSDEDILLHRAWCRCEVCRRPEAVILWRRAMGLDTSKPVSEPPPAPAGSHLLERHLRASERSARLSPGPWRVSPEGRG